MLTGLENGIGPSGTVPSTHTVYSWKANHRVFYRPGGSVLSKLPWAVFTVSSQNNQDFFLPLCIVILF